MPTYTLTGYRGTSLTFDADGARATGNYISRRKWIVGPVSLTASTPTPTTSSPYIHGAQKDPFPGPVGGAQGYDDRRQNIGYDNTKNIARLALQSGPQLLTPTPGKPISIVKVVSLANVGPGDVCIEFADVYHVLHADDVPPNDRCFAPSYYGPTKLVEHWDYDALDLDLLPSVSLSISPTLVATITRQLEGPWAPSHCNGWSRQIHPGGTIYVSPNPGDPNHPDVKQQPPYYEDINAALSSAMVLACSDQRTEGVLVGLIQYGIDCYGARLNGLSFRGSLGHNSGRQQPMLFAAYMLGKEDWLVDLRDNHFTAEHEQTFYVRKTYRIAASAISGTFRHGRTITAPGGWSAIFWGFNSGSLYFADPSGPLTGGVTVTDATSGATCAVSGATTDVGYNGGVGNYTASELGMPEWAHPWGANFSSFMEIPVGNANVNWTAPPAPFPWYRRGNSADSWLGMATVIRALGLAPYFGGVTGNAWFDYTERYAFLEPTGTFTPGYSGAPNTWTPDGDTLPSDLEYDAYDVLWDYEPPTGGDPPESGRHAMQNLGQGFYAVAAAGLGGVLIQ